MPFYRGLAVEIFDRKRLTELTPRSVNVIENKRTVTSYIKSTPKRRYALFVEVEEMFSKKHYADLPMNKEVDLSYDERYRWSKPPFDLLGTVYIDGRAIPERTFIIDLAARRRETSIHSRLALGEDGNLYEQEWSFGEVGVETALANLMIGTDSEAQLERDLANVMTNMCIDEHSSQERVDEAVGTIVVEFQRATLLEVGGRVADDPDYLIRGSINDDGDVDMTDVDPSAHRTVMGGNTLFYDQERRYRNFEDFIPEGEPPFARFVFLYRSDGQLRKLGVLDSDDEDSDSDDDSISSDRRLSSSSSEEEEDEVSEESSDDDDEEMGGMRDVAIDMRFTEEQDEKEEDVE